MVSGGDRGGLIGEKHPLLGVERAVGQSAPSGLAFEATVAAFFAIAADGALRGAGDARAVGSDQGVKLFRFHWGKDSVLGRDAAAGHLLTDTRLLFGSPDHRDDLEQNVMTKPRPAECSQANMLPSPPVGLLRSTIVGHGDMASPSHGCCASTTLDPRRAGPR